jgi:hypothetical protein
MPTQTAIAAKKICTASLTCCDTSPRRRVNGFRTRVARAVT